MERRIKLLERWNERLLRMLRHKQRLEEPAVKPANILN
jgi:hypothetical protein